MNAQELKRWLAKQGCTFEINPSGHGHLEVRLGDRKSELPMHGSRQELGPKLVARIKKDFGLK